MTKPVSGFAPVIGQTQTLNASGTSSSITLSTQEVNSSGINTSYPVHAESGVKASQIRVYNAGPNPAYLRWGRASLTTVTASTTTDMIIPVGEIETFNKGAWVDTIAAICLAGQTAVLTITPGEGGG